MFENYGVFFNKRKTFQYGYYVVPNPDRVIFFRRLHNPETDVFGPDKIISELTYNRAFKKANKGGINGKC